MRASLFGALLSVAVGSVASAGETADQEVERLSTEAVDAYKSARFQKAVELLTRAYAIRPLSPLLYNLAKAYDKMNDAEHAFESYKKYVDTGEADPKLEEKARARMAFYEPQIKAKQAPPPEVKPEKPPGPTAEEIAAKEEQERAKSRTLNLIGGIAVAGVGLVCIGTGIGLYASVDGTHSQFAASLDEPTKRQLAEGAGTLGAVSSVMYAVGGVLLVGSLWFFYSAFFRHRTPAAEPEKDKEKPAEEKPAETTWLPWVSPQGAGLGASWRF